MKQSPFPRGFYGDYPIDLLNKMIASGQVTLPHPHTGEPIALITPEGEPLTARDLEHRSDIEA